MQDKGLDFKHKEVINIKDGKRLGYVQDVCADLETGVITSIIVPGSNKIMNIFTQHLLKAPLHNLAVQMLLHEVLDYNNVFSIQAYSILSH